MVVALSIQVHAQVEVASGWSSHHWGVQHGLPVNSINAMAQDEKGYLWLATMDGLARFDGLKFEVFDSASHPGLVSNRLVVLERDGDALWLLSEDNRLIRYADGEFVTMSRASGLPDERVTVFHRKAGRWWAGTVRGAAWWDGTRFHALDPDHWPEQTQTISSDNDGAVWLGSPNGRVVRWLDGQIDLDLDLGEAVWTLAPDMKRGMWIGHRGGVSQWRDGALEPLPQPPGGIKDVIRIEQAGKDEKYLHGSVTLYRFAGGQMEVLTENLNRSGREQLLLPLPGSDGMLVNFGSELRQNGKTVFSGPSRIDALLVDREHNVWVATAGDGLYRLRANPLTHFGTHPELGTTPAYPIVTDADGQVWVGTGGAGFFRIDGDSRILERPPGEHPITVVYSLLPPDRDGGAAWIGGLGLHSWHDGEYSQDGLPPRLSLAMVRALYRDRDGVIWAGTEADGLWCLDKDQWHQVEVPAPLSSARVRVMTEDTDGNLWLGTNGDGVLRYSQGRFEAIGKDHGLASRLVRALHLDASGRLWIGTETRGLCRIRNPADPPASLAVGCIDRDLGLLHHGIHQILPDGLGHFWMSTNRGIFRVAVAHLDEVLDAVEGGRSARLAPEKIIEAEGLPNREANGGVQSAGTVGPDGRLWFPTMGGPVAIDPRKIDEHQLVPDAVIEGLIFDHELQQPRASTLELPVGRRDLSFIYTAPSFVDPSNLHFEYRLIGYEPVWQSARTRRRIDFTNLPHGSYQFEVRALAAAGTPGAIATQAFELPPRLIETGLFRSAVLALVFGLLVLTWRLREHRNRAERVRLESLIAERTAELDRQRTDAECARDELARQADRLRTLDREKREFFASISHELRTPLSLLIGPLDQVEQDPQLLVEQVPLMRRNARRLNRLVEQILDLQRIEAGQMRVSTELHDLAVWTESLVDLFRPLASQRGIELELLTPAEGILAWFDALQMDKVLGNLLSNAIKYCRPGDRVEIRIARDGEQAQIRVSDTGPGISARHLPKLFDRFYRAEIPGSPIEGTGIGLALSRELMLLHGGEIEAESHPGAGTVFTLQWPARASDGHVDQATTDTVNPLPKPTVEIERQASAGRKRLLLVDDNVDMHDWLESALGQDFIVDLAGDGVEALERIDQALPDVIVSDWMMPNMDGIEFLEALHRRADCAGLPVIMLTARGEVSDRTGAHRAGALAYVAKPFNLEMLRAQVDSVLEQQQRLRLRLAAEAAHGTGPEPAERSAFCSRVLAAIDRHLHDPEFSVGGLAKELAMDRTALFRKLRRELDVTPSGLLRERRLEKAAELLGMRMGTVSEVAYAVGFGSLDGFTRAFRRRFGEPPSASIAQVARPAGKHDD